MKNEIKFSDLLSSILLLISFGLLGGFTLLSFTYPTIWPRWLLYVTVIFLGTGFALPLSYLLNRYFSSQKFASRDRLLRESIGTGVYLAFLLWLSIGRLLTFPLALLFGLALLVIEYLMRMREMDPDSESDQKHESKRTSLR